ncbi:hypothetical protein TSUD_24650 [Trifolium subterraneum]|uniref:Activator of Hsp90 ATPase AHSA1-like N-terminal domain-containing protein n=1 Tax=Trifolium subterraneum TaxID=3900 RepID=A0A2Z6P7T1_TRISU|nr:hypothetical protein TSUD_24650 [Trifolium subterraneum]
MAKYGEGDKRWIVEDRPDGTNVHNWHWSETNCLEWSRTFFNNLFNNLKILDGEGGFYIAVKKVEKVDGEAYVNVRKGKIIPGYEINVLISWEGEARDSDGKILHKVSGNVEIPYISDENADEDPEIRVSVKDEGKIGKSMKDAVFVKGKGLILEKVRVWVESMSKGGPVKDELETKKVPPQKLVKKKEEEGGVAVAAVAKEKEKKKEEGKKGCKTISLNEKFNCRAKDLFEIMMDENRWKGFTQSNARISKEVGGEISIFDGSVTGANLELVEGKLIVQRWRFEAALAAFDCKDRDATTTVRIVFEEPESGVTVVKLTHTDVPEEDRYGNATVVENTERGWRDLIFQRIRNFLLFITMDGPCSLYV